MHAGLENEPKILESETKRESRPVGGGFGNHSIDLRFEIGNSVVSSAIWTILSLNESQRSVALQNTVECPKPSHRLKNSQSPTESAGAGPRPRGRRAASVTVYRFRGSLALNFEREREWLRRVVSRLRTISESVRACVPGLVAFQNALDRVSK